MSTLINVYGTARSGSTMLDLMLGNAPDAFSCGEVSAWFRPYRAHHFTIDCSCGRAPCPVWQRIGFVRPSQFHSTAIRELGITHIIDSSKDLCWLLDSRRWAAAHRIQTHNVLVWKDPVDLAYSHWKRGRGLTEWRREFVRGYSLFFGTGLPFLSVNYNALANSPRDQLAAVCGALGMTFTDGREAFWEKEHHHLFGSSSVRAQVESHRAHQTPTAFPPAFEALRPSVETTIANDDALQDVIAFLRQSDVSSGAAVRRTWRHSTSSIYYLAKRTVRAVRRYVPERYDPSAP